MLFLFVYSLEPVVVSWKSTLFVGINACFKTKLEDRGFNDPDISSGMTYMVNENQYRTYLALTPDVHEPVN